MQQYPFLNLTCDMGMSKQNKHETLPFLIIVREHGETSRPLTSRDPLKGNMRALLSDSGIRQGHKVNGESLKVITGYQTPPPPPPVPLHTQTHKGGVSHKSWSDQIFKSRIDRLQGKSSDSNN